MGGEDHLVDALDKLPSLQQALWSVPLCLTIHNLEEALGVRTLVALLHQTLPWFRLSACAMMLQAERQGKRGYYDVGRLSDVLR